MASARAAALAHSAPGAVPCPGGFPVLLRACLSARVLACLWLGRALPTALQSWGGEEVFCALTAVGCEGGGVGLGP